ncbi:MAG: glycosyltransferase [Parcubacteria group bacterium]
MNAHIVAIEWDTDQILARFVRYLIAGTGWSVSTKPDPRADVNVFMPYLCWAQYPEFQQGHNVAWFTHREEAWPAKALMWDNAERDASLRLACAKLYVDELAKHGPAAQVTAPLERDKFTIMPDRGIRKARPRVGFSGYVYKTGRKGEGMVKRLVDERPKWQIIASGKGWPCECGEWTWHTVQRFYQSLDVYVCSATVEGLPMPPLEALACGCKVVIPSGVGLLDEIPTAPGIVRYTRGDYGQMLQAIEIALDTDADPDELRETTASYSPERFATDFQEAIHAMAW